MDVREPHVRRRGFFLHSTDGNEPDTGELENPEGFGVRVRVAPRRERRQIGSGRSRTANQIESTDPQIRSGSVTGSRQWAHSHR